MQKWNFSKWNVNVPPFIKSKQNECSNAVSTNKSVRQIHKEREQTALGEKLPYSLSGNTSYCKRCTTLSPFFSHSLTRSPPLISWRGFFESAYTRQWLARLIARTVHIDLVQSRQITAALCEIELENYRLTTRSYPELSFRRDRRGALGRSP